MVQALVEMFWPNWKWKVLNSIKNFIFIPNTPCNQRTSITFSFDNFTNKDAFSLKLCRLLAILLSLPLKIRLLLPFFSSHEVKVYLTSFVFLKKFLNVYFYSIAISHLFFCCSIFQSSPTTTIPFFFQSHNNNFNHFPHTSYNKQTNNNLCRPFFLFTNEILNVTQVKFYLCDKYLLIDRERGLSVGHTFHTCTLWPLNLYVRACAKKGKCAGSCMPCLSTNPDSTLFCKLMLYFSTCACQMI